MVHAIARFHLARLEFAHAPRDAYRLHQELWKPFGTTTELERPFLFRADAITEDGRSRLTVLVQSERPPDWSRLLTSLVLCETRDRVLKLHTGDKMRFFLRANPTVRRKGQAEPAFRTVSGEDFRARSGRRVALLRDADRLEWLERKATQSGFAIDRHAVRLQSKRIWRWSRGADSARHDGVDFEGVLTITDPALFAEAVLKGIGSAKAFGFGLLSVAPLQAS